MKSVIVALVGTVALLGATTAGLAQEPDKKKEQRPAAQPKRAAPQPKAAQPQRAAPQQPRAAQPQMQRPAARAPSQRPAAVERARPQRPAAVPRAERRAAEQRRDVQERRADRKRAEQLQGAEQSRSRQERVERAERERTERNRQAQQRDQAQQRREQAQERGEQQRGEQQKARQGEARSPSKQVEKEARRPDTVDKDAARGAQPVARIQATDRQRREVRQRLFRERNVQRISRQRLGAPIAVGSHISRRHRLHRFTPALLGFAPFYASYSYLVVDDTICVVDPETYVIVDVIPASIEQASPGPASQRVLALSREQMRFILSNVPKDRARTDVRIRLALGAEIPRSVELFRFPEAVLARVPEVAPFRYIVVDNDVVIVDPRDYEIALVITE